MINLYIHASHDGCVTAIKDGDILFHHQHDRFNRLKHTSIPSIDIIKELKKLGTVDKVYFTFFPRDHVVYLWQKTLERFKIVRKDTQMILDDKIHHLYHASCAKLFHPYADYFFIWDQHGAITKDGIEQETLYTSKFSKLYCNNRVDNYNIGFGERYAIATKLTGFFPLEDGKTMALAQYKKPGVAYFEQKRLEKKSVRLFKLLQSLHFNKNATVCLAGGVTQNVVNNSNLLKNIKDINLVACPFNGDFGLSLGAAAYHENLHLKYMPMKNIYLGLSADLNTDIFSKYKITRTSYREVSKLVTKDPVAIFQSKSEQGQRGLGNRSLLLDINAPNALKKMNEIKKREWYRPFACSILEEDASTWFNTKGKTSPYMMFVFKSKKPKLTKNVTCVNNTSRIQTVAFSQNFHFHNLLKTHKKFFKKPLLLNTSLNLPGHTLVESLSDLLYLFESTKLKYIYIPEKEILISK
jgi:predicted NodU family carbamoyl transferase